MLDNWVVQNLEKALNVWNDKLSEIWQLITQSPTSFKGGTLWNVVSSIHGALQAIGYALLVLFFVIGVMKTCGSFVDVKKPEHALKLFIRFALAKGAVTYGLELMLTVFSIVQGMVSTIITQSGSSGMSSVTLPQEIADAIEEVGFFQSVPLWMVTFLGSLFITVLSFILIMTVYGRFFRLYMFTALAPLPLASFAGEDTSFMGKAFLKSYLGVCMEGAIVVLACLIFSAFAASGAPIADTSLPVVTMSWQYVAQTIFNMLILVALIKGAERIAKEMFGL